MIYTSEQHGENVVVREGDTFKKKPSVIWMKQLDEAADVQTSEGLMHGNKGDWLCYDPLSTHLWVVSNEYKEMHYVKTIGKDDVG